MYCVVKIIKYKPGFGTKAIQTGIDENYTIILSICHFLLEKY